MIHRAFLSTHPAEVLFDSTYFHRSDDMSFREGRAMSGYARIRSGRWVLTTAVAGSGQGSSTSQYSRRMSRVRLRVFIVHNRCFQRST